MRTLTFFMALFFLCIGASQVWSFPGTGRKYKPSGGGGPAPSVVQQATATSGTGSTTTLNLVFPSACTVGNTVIVATMGRLSSDTITSMTGMGATWSKANSGAQPSSNIEIWRGNCATAGTTVTIVNSNANIQVRIGIEVANLGTNLDVASAVNTTGGWAPNVSMATTHQPGFVFIAMSVDKSVTFTSATNSFTHIATLDSGTGPSHCDGSAIYYITSATGTYSSTLTVNGTGSPTSTAIGAAFY